MARPTHVVQQQNVDDALAAPMSMRWRWLFTPDPRWLNTVNTTNLRTVNAIRMFVLVTLVWVVTFVAVTAFALTRCGILIHLFGVRVFQMLPPVGKLNVEAWRACEESIQTARILDFASATFNTYGLLLGGMAGFAVAAMGIKRATDTEHVERKERAKKAPVTVLNPPVTGEHMPPNVEQTVILDPNGASRERPTGDARTDDEQGP